MVKKPPNPLARTILKDAGVTQSLRLLGASMQRRGTQTSKVGGPTSWTHKIHSRANVVGSTILCLFAEGFSTVGGFAWP